jgi:hypothetical protein
MLFMPVRWTRASRVRTLISNRSPSRRNEAGATKTSASSDRWTERQAGAGGCGRAAAISNSNMPLPPLRPD